MGMPQSQQTACCALHCVKNVALSFSNWRLVLRILPGIDSPPLVLRAGVEPAFVWDALSLLSRAFKEAWKPWPVCSVLWYLCYPLCSATELPKLNMKNGPTISG